MIFKHILYVHQKFEKFKFSLLIIFSDFNGFDINYEIFGWITQNFNLSYLSYHRGFHLIKQMIL